MAKKRFFEDITGSFGRKKVNFPENTLLYQNQLYLSIQKGDHILNSNYFIIALIIPVANVPSDVDSYETADDDVQIIRPMYDVDAREFHTHKRNMDGTISVRGDKDEVFLNYRFDENRWKVLYFVQKRHIPNGLSGTVSNKYKEAVLYGKRKLFLKPFFLLSTTDGKENVNHHRANFGSYPADILTFLMIALKNCLL